jgi:membrane-associated phospholipid phosphatase
MAGTWVGGRYLAEAWRRGRADWRALPASARRRWAVTLLAGWAACVVISAALAVGGQLLAARGMDSWDRQELEALVAADRLSFQAAAWVEAWGSSAVLVPLVALAVVLAARAGRSLTALTLAASYLLHDPIVFVANWIWPRARPDLVAGGIAAPPLHAYPSGHTVQVLAIYGLLAWLWVRRSASRAERVAAALLVAAVAFVVAYARLRMGTHWPSDMWAGALLGLAWLAACVLALRAGERGDSSATPAGFAVEAAPRGE